MSFVNDFLEYNAKYQVLICRECQYAIQKTALDSHLLRHKIYRGDRQHLLQAIAQLELLEPGDVQLPPLGSPPVDGLPVISGFRCTAPNCESLYASSKRMRRHWSEIHGIAEPSNTCARAANIQTFFRGTKIRYFEVVSPENMTSQHQKQSEVPHSPTVDQPTLVSSPKCSGELELEPVRYFHHFTTIVSFTLPTSSQETEEYWRVNVVEHALRSNWLMCGILAISACHVAVFSEDKTSRQKHQKKWKRYLLEFLAGWENAKNDGNANECEQVEIGARLACIHRCGDWIFDEVPPLLMEGQNATREQAKLIYFVVIIQCCVDSNRALRCLASDTHPEKVFFSDNSNRIKDNMVARINNTPAKLQECLQTLPYRLTEIVDQPNNLDDFLASLFALRTLVECCSISFASDSMQSTWTGMEQWLGSLPERYQQLLWNRNPVSLIVFAHWTFLLRKVERHCWFLKGLGLRILHSIAEEFPQGSGAQALIMGLVG
jgi:hypothetical protein